jgi:hypothetical protein
MALSAGKLALGPSKKALNEEMTFYGSFKFGPLKIIIHSTKIKTISIRWTDFSLYIFFNICHWDHRQIGKCRI